MMFEKSIYPNLDAELIKNRITWEALAVKIELPLQLLVYRMMGIYSFTVIEAKNVKKALGVDTPLEELFEEAT